MANRVLRYAGFAEEPEFDPDTPGTPDQFVDIASASLDAPSDTQIEYEGGMERGPRIHRPGWYSPTGDIEYAMDIYTIGRVLRWALGGYNFTADGGSGEGHNLHEYWGQAELLLPTFTSFLGKDVFEHIFTGCTIDTLTINVDDEYVETNLDIVAARDKRADIRQTTDLTMPDQYPLAFHEVTAFRGGDGSDDEISAIVKSLELTVANNVDADSGRGLGRRFAYRLPSGEREITMSLDLWYENIEWLQSMWGGVDGPASGGSTETDMYIKLNAGDDGELTLYLPRCVVTSAQQQPSGRDEVTQSVEIKAYVDDVERDDNETVRTELFASLENELVDLS